MPRFSHLLDDVPQYPFARVGKLSREIEKRDGVEVINARIGIPDVEAPSTIKKVLSKYILQDQSTYGYPVDVHPEGGVNALVDAIVLHYRERYGVDLKRENIAVTGWTKEVLHNLARIFDGAGIVPEPVYPAYESAIVLASKRVRRVQTNEDSNWLPHMEFEKDDGFFYFCDPNNPVGNIAEQDYYEDLLEKIRKQDIGGIFDKAYKDYVFDGETNPVSITQIPELMNYGYEVVSFSKHFNFVGLGLGWVVSSPQNISRWLRFSGQFSQGVEWYKQMAGMEALTNVDVKKEMSYYMNELKERRNVFVKGLNQLGLSCKLPRATPYLWVKVPESYGDEDFVLNKLLSEAHVAFMPGSYFGRSGEGYLRATIFLSKTKIREAIARIETIRDW